MSKTCGKCGGRMGEGFLLDRGDGNASKLTEWVAGAPDRRWYGLKIRGRQKLTVETWRCERCGFLESYAPAS